MLSVCLIRGPGLVKTLYPVCVLLQLHAYNKGLMMCKERLRDESQFQQEGLSVIVTRTMMWLMLGSVPIQHVPLHNREYDLQAGVYL